MNHLPLNWKSDRLKDVAAINASALSAGTDPNYEFDYLEISNVDYFGVVDATDIKRLRFEDAPSRARRRLAQNATLISSVRPNLQAAAFFSDNRRDFICSTGFNVVQPNETKLCPRFAYYTLISSDSCHHFEATAKGVGYPAVDDKDFATCTIPLPPLPEQERIAAYLDASCAAIDEAVAAKRRQLETLDGLRSTTINEAVTRGITPNRELTPSNIHLIPQIPKGWRIERLKDIAEIRYGLGQPPSQHDSGPPMIRATNIDAGKILENDLLRIDESELPLGKKPYLKEGEIIVVRSGVFTGDSAIVPAKFAGSVAGYDMVVTATTADPVFVSYALLSSYVLDGQLLLLKSRAAQAHLNAEELGTAIIVLPESRAEQTMISNYVQERLGQLELLEGNIRCQVDVLGTYRKSMIHECVTGKRRITEADLKQVGPHA